MKITAQRGMVNIDTDEISFGNIKDMYKTGDGYGLQLSERLEPKRKLITEICNEIAKKIYELQDILGEKLRTEEVQNEPDNIQR